MRRLSTRRLIRRSRRRGYKTGYANGYRLGCCESVVRSIEPASPPYRDLSVLFVPQGFEAIDIGIILGFRGLIRELIVVRAHDMLAAAEAAKPDLVVVMNGLHVFPDNHLEQIGAIRNLGLKTAIWFVDDPYYTDYSLRIAPHYDYVFTHEMSCVPFYRANGCRETHYLPLAVPTSIYKPRAVKSKYWSDICFIGNAFPNRIAFFDQVLPHLAHRKIVLIGSLWNRLAHYRRFAGSIQLQWASLPETVNYYNGAKVVVNLHRPAINAKHNRNEHGIPGHSINPRTYEIAACGAFQLTDVRDDLSALYAPGTEIETYASAHEFIQKVNYYLAREPERLAIAARGLRRTLRDHLFPFRLQKLLSVVFGSV